MDFVEKLKELLVNTVFKGSLDFPVALGIFAAIVILIFFGIAVAISTGCKITRYRKKLIAATKSLNSYTAITEDNVDVVYNEVSTHPDGVQKGWAAFMDQRIGYPSDYITAKEVVDTREFSGKGAAAKVFLIIAGLLVCLFSALVGFVDFGYDDSMSILNVVSALEFMIIPVAVYIICILILDIIFNRKIRRLGLTFISFCEMLDAKVVVSDKDEREFVSDNLEEINRRVEELIAGRMGEDEVIEVITAPKIAEIEEIEDVKEEEPVEEVEETEIEEMPEAPEAPVALADMTEQERDEFFRKLVALVDRAIADETCTDDDYAEIAATIYDAAVRTGAIDDPEDMAVFEACFDLLANPR